MEFKKKQATKQTTELTKKELIEIVKETVEKQLSAYDKKQKRAHAASFVGKFIRLLFVGAIMVVVSFFLPKIALTEDDENDEVIIEDDETTSV